MSSVTKRHLLAGGALLLIAVVVTGCAVGPDYSTPRAGALGVPSGYSIAAAIATPLRIPILEVAERERRTPRAQPLQPICATPCECCEIEEKEDRGDHDPAPGTERP